MDANCSGKQYEEGTQSPMLRNKYSATEQCNPDHRHRQDLDFQWDGLIFHKIADIRAESGMVQKPVIKSLMASKKKCCSK